MDEEEENKGVEITFSVKGWEIAAMTDAESDALWATFGRLSRVLAQVRERLRDAEKTDAAPSG